MISADKKQDARLKRRLFSLAQENEDYWSFKGNSKREHGHGFFQYPAMMVPQVARAVLSEISRVYPRIECVGDPFVGSGTILTESMLMGLDFVGKDINPLAVLLCRAKAGPFFIRAMSRKAEELILRIQTDKSRKIEVRFPNLNKWFQRDIQVGLSRVRRSILEERNLWARRFFWVVLAETVRATCNSRSSTYKLHMRPECEISKRAIKPIEIFEKLLKRNTSYLRSQKQYLDEKGYLKHGRYKGNITIELSDARNANVAQKQQYDIIITSPPYGDNTSTVAYGQYSYLPLQWIDLSDIDSSIDPGYLRTTHEIDARSLGGRKNLKNYNWDSITTKSTNLKKYLGCLSNQPEDCPKRIVAFFRDLDACLVPILANLRVGGLMVWILGNRKVGGKRVPLDKILINLLANHSVDVLVSMKRQIPSKRMPYRNNITETISAEMILVMRKVI